MPSSLIIVGLVVAWLVVLVPMVARKRQEVARTAEATSAVPDARRDETSSSVEEEFAMPDAGHTEAEPAQPEDLAAPEDGYELEDGYDDGYDEYLDDDEPTPRPYRPGRGGFDAETAARVARAKYAFRQRVVLLLLLGAVGTAVAAVAVTPLVWWAHGVLDLTLVGYLSYLRRQVRIEEDVRARRLARLRAQPARRPAPRREPRVEAEPEADLAPVAEEEPRSALVPRTAVQPTQPRPGTVVVDLDDEDPVFVELDGPSRMPYRRAAGE